MEKINFENFKSPGISKEILMQLQDNIEEAIEGEVLFENAGGLSGNIELSSSPSNYREIELFVGKAEIGVFSVKIPSELYDKKISLTQAQDVLSGGNYIFQIVQKQYEISGSYLIVAGRPSCVNVNGITINAHDPEDMILCYKVIGYK